MQAEDRVFLSCGKVQGLLLAVFKEQSLLPNKGSQNETQNKAKWQFLPEQVPQGPHFLIYDCLACVFKSSKACTQEACPVVLVVMFITQTLLQPSVTECITGPRTQHILFLTAPEARGRRWRCCWPYYLW